MSDDSNKKSFDLNVNYNNKNAERVLNGTHKSIVSVKETVTVIDTPEG